MTDTERTHRWGAGELVYCENHSGQHPIVDTCRWPHYVPPAGPQPQVGHPLRVTE